MNINKICNDSPPELRPEIETLAKAVEAMKRKIETQLPIYDSLPLAQSLTTTQGEKALKANPALQEFRATVKDYAQMLNNLMELSGRKKNAEKPKAELHIVGNSKWKKHA